MCPIAHSDGHDAPRLRDELVPSVAAVIDDVLGGFEDAVGEPVVAHELPGVFCRVQFGRLGRQEHDGDVGGKIQPVGGVPARLIHQQDGVGIGGDGLGDFGKMQVHRRDVANGQDQASTLAFGRTDGAEDVGRLGPLIVRGDGTCAALGPTPGDLVFLADPGLVLEPDLYARAGRLAVRDRRQAGGELFLKAAAASGFCA